MNQRDFRMAAIFCTDTGSNLLALIQDIGEDESCDLTPTEIEIRVEEMIKHGLLMRPKKGEDRIKVSESGWQLWATKGA